MTALATILTFVAMASCPVAAVVLYSRRVEAKKAVITATSLGVVCWIGKALLLMQTQAAFSIPLFDYLAVDTEVPLQISFGLRIDPVNSVWLVIANLVALVTTIVADSRDSGDSKRAALAILMHVWFASLFVLSANIGQMLICWIVTSVSAHYLCYCTRSKLLDDNGTLLNRGFAIHRIADLFITYAVFLIWSRFGTLELVEILSSAQISMVMERHASVVATIAISLVLAAGSRVGIVPFHLGDDALESGSQRTSILLQAGTLCPAAVFLLVRFSPLFSASIKACSIMCVVCGLSVCLTAVIAVAQKRRRLAMANISASFYGLMFIGISTGYFDGLRATVFLLASFQLSFCLLNLPRLTAYRQRIKLFALVGTILLATTLWGQGAVLSAVWRTAQLSQSMGIIGARQIIDPNREILGNGSLDVGKMAEVLSRRELQSALQNTYWLGIAACFFLSLALVRCQFKWPEVDLSNRSDNDQRKHQQRYTSAVFLVVILVAVNFATVESLLNVVLAKSFPGDLVQRIPRTMGNWIVRNYWDYLFDLIVLPIGLMGALIGWILFSRPSEMATKAEYQLGPFARLSQHRFYFPEMYEFGCLWPTRVMSLVGQFLDRVVFSRLFRWMPDRVVRWCENAMGPLMSSSLLLYALATTVGVVGMLCVVLSGGE